jgi:8-oxo-dGTP pyrophosphatase MutT (NUDIX family)
MIINKHSAGGVVIHENKVLAISWTTREYIAFPKGGINNGESSKAAAVREVFEETGYHTKVVAPINSWTYEFDENSKHYRKTVDYYLMELIDDATPTPERETGEDFENLWLDFDSAHTKLTFGDAKGALKIALIKHQRI